MDILLDRRMIFLTLEFLSIFFSYRKMSLFDSKVPIGIFFSFSRDESVLTLKFISNFLSLRNEAFALKFLSIFFSFSRNDSLLTLRLLCLFLIEE
jgi:hypothetical protein